mmetsp:Transcript_21460/g.43045  ORF Transcript_21460/g.43045 Transcript_21460/m.43045 type:complete len:587 (+) Transcript_21460:52-1812(+)
MSIAPGGEATDAKQDQLGAREKTLKTVRDNFLRVAQEHQGMTEERAMSELNRLESLEGPANNLPPVYQQYVQSYREIMEGDSGAPPPPSGSANRMDEEAATEAPSASKAATSNSSGPPPLEDQAPEKPPEKINAKFEGSRPPSYSQEGNSKKSEQQQPNGHNRNDTSSHPSIWNQRPPPPEGPINTNSSQQRPPPQRKPSGPPGAPPAPYSPSGGPTEMKQGAPPKMNRKRPFEETKQAQRHMQSGVPTRPGHSQPHPPSQLPPNQMSGPGNQMSGPANQTGGPGMMQNRMQGGNAGMSRPRGQMGGASLGSESGAAMIRLANQIESLQRQVHAMEQRMDADSRRARMQMDHLLAQTSTLVSRVDSFRQMLTRVGNYVSPSGTIPPGAPEAREEDMFGQRGGKRIKRQGYDEVKAKPQMPVATSSKERGMYRVHKACGYPCVCARTHPHVQAGRLNDVGLRGRAFETLEKKIGQDRNIYLRISDGGGWVFMFDYDEHTLAPIKSRPILQQITPAKGPLTVPFEAVVKVDFRDTRSGGRTLDVKRGDIVEIAQVNPNDWCLASDYDGKQGWLPKDYLTRIEALPTPL